VLLSVVLGGATVLWPYGTSFFSEAFLAAAFIWAAVFLLESRTAERPAGRVAAAAVLIVVAGLTKLTSLVFAPAFVLAIVAERAVDPKRRTQVALAIGAAIAIAAAAQLGWNQFRFGTPFEFGYDWRETIPTPPARAFAIGELPRGVAVLLFAPGKSLFVWAPMLVLALLNLRAAWDRDRALAMGMVSALAAGLIVFGAYLFPEGGYAHGPRHLVPIVPLLALALAGSEARSLAKPALGACALVGFVMAVFATRVSYLEDQALRRDPAGRPVAGYYEVVEPAPGRPNNRYRFEHIPFVTAMGTPGWAESRNLGQGPDYFYRHLQQARAQLPDGQSIPEWLPWTWAGTWSVIGLAAGAFLVREYQNLN
jgi:hypothetical protein